VAARRKEAPHGVSVIVSLQRENDELKIYLAALFHLLAEIAQLLEAGEERMLPQSGVGKAIRTTRSNWAALNRNVEDGRLEIDNNACERQMRAVATGAPHPSDKLPSRNRQRGLIRFFLAPSALGLPVRRQQIHDTLPRHRPDSFQHVAELVRSPRGIT
jgi:hypothetical protein